MSYAIKSFHFSFFLVNKLIAEEGPFFLQMRIKHLLKSNCIPQATALSKLCAESKEISNVSSFQQAYITCLCFVLPNEDAIKEVSKAGNCCCHSHLLRILIEFDKCCMVSWISRLFSQAIEKYCFNSIFNCSTDWI